MKLTTAILAAAMLFSTAAFAGEFKNYCAMGLASGQKIQTDCSISMMFQGKEYCFGSKEAMAQFMKNPEANLAAANKYYEKLEGGK